VIGDPVRHSLSPTIHNAAFEALGLDWVYVALPVAAGEGRRAVEAMATLGIDGLSVTMPHKADVAAAVDELTPVADRLGVCNCVFRRGGALVGDSTDGDGFVRSLAADNGVTLEGRKILVVGTGGAASSIIEAAGRHGPSEIVVVSRSRERAQRAAELAEMARAGSVEEIGGIDVVVNASPVGMGGGPDPEGIPVPVELLGPHHVVVDIVYQPLRTPLLAAAERTGANPVNGVGMLVHQAALAFERWTGEPAPIEAMTRTVADLVSS
jgi:shikimate dehydrogenase